MTVIHASYLEPGVKGNSNYHGNVYSKQYLSCSLISGRELNTFGDVKTLFVMDVNGDSYMLLLLLILLLEKLLRLILIL